MPDPHPVKAASAVRKNANIEVYATYGSVTDTPTEETTVMWWDRELIESTVNRQFVLSKLRPNEQPLLDQELRFGAGLTDDTYLDWIEEKAKRIFLILCDIGVPDQIFGVIDDSWDDDDLPLPLDQIERLKLTPTRDQRLEKKFFIRQYSYLLRSLEKGENIYYADDEVVPLDLVDRRALTGGLPPSNIDKVSLPNKPDIQFTRQRIPLGRGEGRMAHADYLAGLDAMRIGDHRHLTSLWASYVHGYYAYVLTSPVSDSNLRSFLTTTPGSIKILTKDDRRLLMLNWIHCLADGLAFLHSKGKNHGKITPSNILLDDDNNIFYSDTGIFDQWESRKVDEKEIYDYAAPEQMELIMKPLNPLGRTETRSSRGRPDSATPSSGSAPAVQPPTGFMYDPQKADIFSFGCIVLEILNFLVKRASRSFATHRASKSKMPSRSAGTADSSFHHNPNQVESWMEMIAKDASKKSDRLFRGVSHILSLVSRMIQSNPDARPTAQYVADRIHSIMLEICGIDAIKLHCVSHKLGADQWDFGFSNLRVGENIGGKAKTDPLSPTSPTSPYGASSSNASSNAPDTFSVATKRSNGSKTSGSKTGSSGNNGKNKAKAKAWQAPVYAEFSFGF